MKLILTPKETRKLTAAIALIDNTLTKLPTSKWGLKSTASISHCFEVKEDGSSELNIHERSFSTFLEVGSESIIQLGQLASQTYSNVKNIFTTFYHELEDTDTAIEKRGESFQKDKPVSIIVEGLHIKTEDVPYSIRLSVARKSVTDKKLTPEQAADKFSVTLADLLKG